MKHSSNINKLSQKDLKTLTEAKKDLEDVGLVMKGMNMFGGIIDKGVEFIPKKFQKILQDNINKLLQSLVNTNLHTMKKGKVFKKPSQKSYKALVTSTGALSGLFGSTTGVGTFVFVADLTVATNFMMRSIMDIARSEGEDLYNIETQLNCLQVFAMGGNSKDDDSLDTVYYSGRIALDNAVKGASAYLTKNGIQGLNKILMNSTNPLLKLFSMITSRFTVQASEKFLAQAIPVAGAVGGGTINLLFINHFQKMAKAHFAIRRLEREYGREFIEEKYKNISNDLERKST